DRLPETHPYTIAGRFLMWAACQTVIYKQWKVQSAGDEQAIRSSETGIALNQFELTIPHVHLELSVRHTTQTDQLKECQRQLSNIRHVVSYVVSRTAHIQRVSADNSLGEIDEILSLLIQVCVIAAQSIVRSGNHFYKECRNTGTADSIKCVEQLVQVIGDRVVPYEFSAEFVANDGLEYEGKD